MPQFVVQWLDAAMARREQRVEAADPGDVPTALGVPAPRVLSVRPLVPEAGPVRAAATAGAWRRSAARFPLRLFSQELSVLLDAGIPVMEALVTLQERDGPGRAASPLTGVIDALRDGRSLSAAFAREPAAFDPLFVALVAASERSGQLAPTLRAHAAYLAWTETLHGRLVAAAVYPVMLLTVSGAVVVFLLLYVLPRFAGVFDGLARDVPAASRWLIDLGVLASAHPVVTLGAACAIPLAAVMAWRLPAARRAVASLAWRSGALGPRLRVIAAARLYRSLGLLLSAGVAAVPALRLVHGVAAAPMHGPLQVVTGEVADGIALSQALQAHGLATPVALRMLRVGERSGTVPAMLERAAAFHDEEIERFSDLVSRTVNPVLMLVMGVLIGGIVVLMYLPIFSLMEQVQ